MKLKDMAMIGLGASVARGEDGPPTWQRFLAEMGPKLAGDNRPMIKSMLEFYLLFSGVEQNAAHFFDYGCWCQLSHGNAFFGQRKGRPLDVIDRNCRNWHRCYKCLVIDDEQCVGDDQEYKVDFVPNENR